MYVNENFTHNWFFFYNKSILFAFILKKFCIFFIELMLRAVCGTLLLFIT